MPGTLVGQFGLDAIERRLAAFGWMGVEMERNEQGRLRACSKRAGGQS